MTKEQIANNYLEETKNKFLKDTIKKGRKAIIFGAFADNIAGTIAQEFEKQNIEVMRIDKQYDSSEDVSLDKNIKKIAKECFENSDILVLAHSTMQLKWFEDYTDKEMDAIINNNLVSHMKVVRSWIKATIGSPYKKYIIFVGSMAYNTVLNGSIPYCISKAGIGMLAKGLAWELAPKNYNVITLHPSNTQDAPMSFQTIKELEKFRNISHTKAIEYWSSSCPKGKFLSKQEIANMALFFISGDNDYLSGANIEFRGGQR